MKPPETVECLQLTASPKTYGEDLLVTADVAGTTLFILTTLRLRKLHFFEIKLNSSNNRTTDQSHKHLKHFRC